MARHGTSRHEASRTKGNEAKRMPDACLPYYLKSLKTTNGRDISNCSRKSSMHTN